MPDSVRTLVFIPFIIVKVLFNYLAALICHVGDALPLRIIFINTNAMINRMLLCWALASKFDVFSIIFVVSIDILQTLAHIFFVCGPLQLHNTRKDWPIMLLFWLIGKE